MSLGVHAFARVAGMIQQDDNSIAAFADGLGGLATRTYVQILVSVLVVLIIFSVRRALLVVMRRRVVDARVQYRWIKISRYVALGLGLLALVLVWSTAIRSTGTFLGLLSAGLAIVLKDLVADVAG